MQQLNSMVKVMSRRTGLALLLLAATFIAFCTLGLTYRRATRAAGFETFGNTPNRTLEFQFKQGPFTANASDTLEEREDVLFDGVRRFVRNHQHTRPELIFLVLTKDESSWGHESRQPSRTFYDFLCLLGDTQLDLRHTSLGIMTSSEAEYNLYRNATAYTSLPRVTILLKQSDEDRDPNLWTSIPRGGRHSVGFQTERRSKMAGLRNELMGRAVHDEQHIVWIDSDVRYFSPGLVQTMLFHSENREDAGIITARCQMGSNPDYDANSWAGSRSRSPSSGRYAEPAIAQEQAKMTQKHVVELITNTSDDDIVHLDSVGGTVLYIRASLVRKGLTFPPYYVIGTHWGGDGWDGLETEGMCYVARYLKNGGCHVLGGSHYVQHTNN